MERQICQGQIYRHFKNKLYQIVAIAYHSETKEKYVVYQALYGDFKTYIRPYDMFMSEVDHEKYPEVTDKYRFTLVNPDEELEESCIPHKTTKEAEESAVNPYLMAFFDKETSKDKIEYLNTIRDKIDDRLISDIAASMDLTVEDGDIDDRFISLINCLKTMAHFECGRLR